MWHGGRRATETGRGPTGGRLSGREMWEEDQQKQIMSEKSHNEIHYIHEFLTTIFKMTLSIT